MEMQRVLTDNMQMGLKGMKRWKAKRAKHFDLVPFVCPASHNVPPPISLECSLYVSIIPYRQRWESLVTAGM